MTQTKLHIKNLLKSHFGTEATPQSRRIFPEPRTLSHKKTHGGLLLKGFMKKDEYIYEYEYEYIYIHNKNMTKYRAINLNAGYRLSLKYSRADTYVFSKNIFDFLQHMYLY